MAKPRKPSAKLTNALLEAISFLSQITKDEGAPFETHVSLSTNTATAYNGVLSAGMVISEDISCAPNAKMFRAALSKCGQEYTLTIDGSNPNGNNKIIVKSGKFKAVVPCIGQELLTTPFPDEPVAVIDDRFKEALAVIDIIKVENGQRVELLSFLLNGQSVIATDGKIIIERYHGIDLPTDLPIPRVLIPAIVGSSKKLAKFGCSGTSVTFFFEDKSWIKSQLYAQQYPVEACMNILNKPSNAVAIPEDFYKALEAVAPFCAEGTVWFERELLCSHKVADTGATHEVKGLPKGPIYTARYLQMIKGLADKIDFTVPGMHGSYYAAFYGSKIRGIIAGHG